MPSFPNIPKVVQILLGVVMMATLSRGNLIQVLPDASQSTWGASGGNSLADASLIDTGGSLADAFDSAGTLSIQTRPDHGTLTATNAWTNRAITPQTGQFTASFVTVPSGPAIDTVLGFSNAPADFWDDLAAYVRFNPAGRVDARNAASFAAVNVLNYVAGNSYLVEMTINVGTKRYGVTVTPSGGSPVIIASNYAFRTEQNSVSQLSHFVCQIQSAGSLAVSNLITPSTEVILPALVFPDSNGPMTSAANGGGVSVSKVIELVPGAHGTVETITITNAGSVARNVAFSIADNYGFDGGTVVHLTSSGDTVVSPGDRWFISSDRSDATERGDEPALRVSWIFPVTVPAPAWIQIPGSGNDQLSFAFSWSLPPGDSAVFSMRRELFGTASSAIPFLNEAVTVLADSGPGSLRQIVAFAMDGGSVNFDPSLDGKTITLSGTPIPIDKNLSIDASTLPAGLILSGGGLSGILEIGGDVEVRLTGLTFTGAVTDSGRSAIVNTGHLVMDHCIVHGNQTWNNGGGIHNTGFLEVMHCDFSNNFGYNGGAIYSEGDANITHSTFRGNGAGGSGGAVWIDESILSISRSTLAHNSNNGEGGAIIFSGVLDMDHCSVVGNLAVVGGGLSNSGGYLELSGSIIADNRTDEGEASDIDGPIDSEDAPSLLGTLDGTSGHSGPVGSPLLQPLGIYGGSTLTMPPQPGSPAIDAGGQASGTDQRGLPRQVGAAADIGAVESGNDHPSITVTTVTDEDDGNLSGAISLREAMRYGDLGSLIRFAPALNAASITLANRELIAARNQIVDAGSLVDGITISGADSTQVVRVRLATSASLKGLIVRDGNGENGGGILNEGTLSLLDCVIADCTAASGGGIYSTGSLDLGNCRVEGNLADTRSGGGIFFDGEGTYFVDSSLLIRDSSITGNSLYDRDGAGLYVSSGFAVIENSTFTNNDAFIGHGGAISNAGYIYLTSCTVTGNSAECLGGGIANYSYASLVSCTIANNRSRDGGPVYDHDDFGGGGIYNEGIVHLLHSIVANNTDLSGTAPDIRGVVEPQAGQNLIGNPQGCVGFTGLVNDPLLGTLADYGGPTQTMLPQAGSPAIDAAGTHSLTMDQRGQPRVSGLTADLGSVELQFLTVTTLEDSGAGSLRQAISSALTNSIIVFHPTLDGRTIRLSSGALAITTPVRIDGRLLSNGITISGAGESRVIEVASGSNVVLANLNIADGKSDLSGAGIYNHGHLTLERSTVCHNFSFMDGGGIYNTGQLVLTNSTVAANRAADAGGGIYNDLGSISAIHSTISDNTATLAAGGGIGNNGSVWLENSIVAGNHAVTYTVDFNLHDFSGHDPTETGSNFRTGNPRLGPLGNYGSGVRTMPPLPGSPVMEAATLLAFTPTTDQLGNPRPSGPLPDLGAVEAFAFSTLHLADTDDDDFPDILESAFGLVVGIDDSTTDSDGDGSSDADELRNMTDPFDPADSFRITGFTPTSGFDPQTLPAFTVSFPTFPGLRYSIEADRNLDYQGSDQKVILGPFVATGFHQQVDVVLRTGRDFIWVKRE